MARSRSRRRPTRCPRGSTHWRRASLSCVLIVLVSNPANTLREQLRRLWKRSQPRALWIGANIAVAGISASILFLGGLTLGAYLSDYGISESCPPWVVVGVLVGFGGPIAGVKLWRWAGLFFLGIVGLLVRAAVERDREDRAQLTALERRTLAPLNESLDEVERLVQQAKDTEQATPLQVARERWQNAWRGPVSTAARFSLPRRFEALEAVLADGARAAEGDVALFAETALVVVAEARDGLERLLTGQPQTAGAFVWPETWPAMRDVDTLRTRLGQYREAGA